MYLLAGDIGATKTNLAIYENNKFLEAPLIEKTYKSKHFKTFDEMLLLFLKNINFPIDGACIGVAGPVKNDRVMLTNLEWSLDSRKLQKLLSTQKVRLINDLVAAAHSISILEKDELVTINEGKPQKKSSNLAIIAPGTGLGESFLVWENNKHIPQPSEGGNTDFGPRNQLEMELLIFLKAKFDHVGYELVCSGKGICNIYDFLKTTNFAPEPMHVARELQTAEDPTPIIVSDALSKEPSQLCKKTLEVFVSILGAESGNLAMKVLATGGIYLFGGIPPRITPYLQAPQFFKSFQDKGKFSSLLADIPVHIVKNTKAPLIGAAKYGYENVF